ncbi:MAG: hypothetical protein JO255_06655 [Alphaproteobacteria bacterium]|nr:hypothetical protein [Alphaproteobacteria bacterium]
MISWILGIVAGLFALLGAVLASHAIDIGMATFGFGLAVFGTFFIFWLVKDHFDEDERRRHQG